MNWRAYAVRFAIARSADLWMRSGRTPTSGQLAAFMLVAPLYAVFFLATEVRWHLTGRGRGIRHAFGHDQIQVIPGPRGIPKDFRDRLNDLIESNRAEHERMIAELERSRARSEG